MNPAWYVLLTVLGTAALIGILATRKRMLWDVVYEFVYSNMYNLDQDNDYNQLVYIRNMLITEFDLTVKQADDCIANWQFKFWFKSQPWLRKPYEKRIV